MLGKLASIVTLTQELKTLSNEGRVGGWGMTELPTGGGKTKRWILIWTATPLRLCDSLSRKDLPPSLKKSKPASGEKRGKVLKLGPGWTRKELYGVIKGVLDDLDGCFCYPDAVCQAQQGAIAKESRMQEYDQAMLDVIVTQESWIRRARRAKLHAPPSTTANDRHPAPDSASPVEPLLMAKVSIIEVNDESSAHTRTGLTVKLTWTYGMDAVKFESFAMFLLAAVERKVELCRQSQSQ